MSEEMQWRPSASEAIAASTADSAWESTEREFATVKESDPLRGVVRAVTVIRALNKLGTATVLDVARETKIPRPTIYRLLSTLQQLGYVQATFTNDNAYRLTHLVRSLSDGFKDEDWVAEIAGPEINHLRAEVIWPTDLATFSNDAMYIRETTRRYSPFTVDLCTVGERLPMLLTAAGKAYLAYCPESEREAILQNLRYSSDPHDRLAGDSEYVAKTIKETLEAGYGRRYGEYLTKTASIAVPIMTGHRVLGTVAIVFNSSAAKPEQMAERYLDALKATCSAIEQKLARKLSCLD